jgi:hypothetical protein
MVFTETLENFPILAAKQSSLLSLEGSHTIPKHQHQQGWKRKEDKRITQPKRHSNIGKGPNAFVTEIEIVGLVKHRTDRPFRECKYSRSHLNAQVKIGTLKGRKLRR